MPNTLFVLASSLTDEGQVTQLVIYITIDNDYRERLQSDKDNGFKVTMTSYIILIGAISKYNIKHPSCL